MPPHCDSLDGPVVSAARRALESGDVEELLAYVAESAEDELRQVFAEVVEARRQGPAARELADRHLFENAVRLHRAGEGAPYTGLKPAGLDVGPVIPLAEEAIRSGSPEALLTFLTDAVRNEVRERLAEVSRARHHAGEDLHHARRYVQSSLGLQVWAHSLHQAVRAVPHEHGGGSAGSLHEH